MPTRNSRLNLINEENIALQISHILYTFVLRAEICTTFEPKVVQTSIRNTKVYKNGIKIHEVSNIAIFDIFFLKARQLSATN